MSSMRFHPIGGGPEDDKDGQEGMVHGENRIPYWIDRRLNGLAGSEYHATISLGCPLSLKTPNMENIGSWGDGNNEVSMGSREDTGHGYRAARRDLQDSFESLCEIALCELLRVREG